MSTRQAGRGRLDRLAGDGNSAAGIDLASLFRVILNQLQDSPAPVAKPALIRAAQDAISNHARVEHWYGQFGDSPWDALLADALIQLQARRYAIPADGGWAVGPDFATGKRLVVVPARSRKNRSVGVILYPATERTARGDAEKLRMEVTSLAASLRESGPGLRPLAPEHVDALAQSMRDFGYRPERPLLVDQHGRLLDGRHRRAAADRARRDGADIPDELPTRLVRVASDEEAVGLAILVNLQRGWTKAERSRIDAVLQAAGLTVESFGRVLGTTAKRELVKAALLADASRSDRAIADAAGGISHHTVAAVRAELEADGQIAHCADRKTADGKSAPGARPKSPSGSPRLVDEGTKEAIIREAMRRLEAGEHTDFRRIAAEQRVGEAFVQQCIAVAKDRIKQAAQVAEAIASEPAPAPAEEGPAPSASSSRHASAHSRPGRLMRRISRLLSQWETEPDDPASELEELEALRREIDERIAALRQEPDHD